MSDPVDRLARLEGVPSAYVGTRDGLDALLRDRGLRRTTPAQTAESLLLGAHASAVLAGSDATLESVRADGGDAVSRAAVHLNTGLLALVPATTHSPLQVFARLHSLVAAGASPDETLGRPTSPDAARRLRELAASLEGTAAPALVVAAIVHAELATAAVFVSHNGLVARAAERLVFVARGVDQASVLVPEAGHLSLRPAYESNLRAYAEGGPAGMHAWLLYAAEAYARAGELAPIGR